MWLFNPKQQTPLTLKNTNPIFTYLSREKSFSLTWDSSSKKKSPDSYTSHLRLIFKEEKHNKLSESLKPHEQRRSQEFNLGCVITYKD